MSEIYRGADRAFLAIPENVRDWLTVKAAEHYLQFGGSHKLKTARAKRNARRIFKSWLEGKQVVWSEEAEGLLEGFNFNVIDDEKLNINGGELLVSNLVNTGPLRGNWFKFLVNYAVAEKRERQGNYEARWVQREVSEYPLFQDTPFGIQKRRLSQMLSRSFNTILVYSQVSKDDNRRAIDEMAECLQDDGVLVVCPEGRDSRVLRRGAGKAGGMLLNLASKTGAVIRPVAVWDEGDNLNVRFGDVIRIDSSSTISSQDFADLTMTEVGRLLPKARRGVYRKIIA